MPQQFKFNLINNTGAALNRTALVGLPTSTAPPNIAANGVGVAVIDVPDAVGGVPGVGLLRYGDVAGNDWRITMTVPAAGAPNAAGIYAGAPGHAIALVPAGPPPPYVYNVTYT